MKQNKLTFDTENLVVHWLEISIEGLYDLEEIQALANYFDKKLELNSTFRESAKRSSQSLISRPANKFNVLFVQTCLKYWSGTKLIFSGENGTHFYKLVQEKKVDWEILKLGSLSLSRFDVYYFEKINDSDESSVKYFLQDCVKNLEEKRKNISYSLSYGKKKGGYLLRIGSRQSSKHLRIYQKRDGLEFELEIKKQETKKRGSFLFSNQLEKFEDSSIRCYYEYLWNYLIFENPFTEWLVVGGRKLRMTRFLSDSLALSYLKPKLARNIYQNFDKKPETFCFIQLLSFLDQRKDKIQILERSLGFVKMNFQAEDFFNFIGISLDKMDARKLAKIADIMHQQSPRMTVFSETPVEKRFQSKSILADIKFTKIRKGPFIGEMVLAEEVYQYRYPFYLPESLLFLPTYNDYYRNYTVKIKLLFIESYSSSAVEKRMPIKDFLSQFHRSNQKIAKIKKDILIIFNDLQKKDLIDSRFKLISKTGKEIKLTKLSTSRFTEYDTICFYEKIQSKEIKLN